MKPADVTLAHTAMEFTPLENTTPVEQGKEKRSILARLLRNGESEA
jgi:hypothetical protein